MTYQKPGPADPHLLNDSTPDHSTHVNSHEDIRPPSRICAENTVVGGICSNHPCEKRATENRPPPNQTLQGRKRHDLPTMPYLAKTQQQWIELLETRNETRASLEKYLREELARLELSTEALRYLWSASVDPPVTKASLSELDLVRIVNDARLRHDVNFDREVLFRPNMQGEVGQRKRALEEGYWDTLIIELAIYITRRRNMSSHGPDSPTELDEATLDKVPLRLPRMFRAIQEILKTLVPVSEWATVDARLDVELLVQQMDKGVCDILGLSQWLGSLLLGSCSPMRDGLVSTMMMTIRQGVETDHAGRIVNGLKFLFAILETMKLDVANHQIRHLRLLMVDDFIHFEQKVFLRRIPREPNLIHARSWFQVSGFKPEAQENGCRAAQLLFQKAVIKLITTNCLSCPPTFEHDFDRIRVLQLDFQFCITQAACGQTFIETLHQLGHNRLPSPESCDDLLNRISALITNEDSKLDAVKHVKDVALEIVRESCAICGLQNLPSDELLETTEKRLLKSWNPASALFRHFDEYLSADLIDLVDQEVEAIANLTPLQILNHLNPPPFPISHSHHQQHHQHQQHWAQDEKLQNGLLSIAKRIAHIAVLHWRVWAPILYLQPWSLDIHGTLVRLGPLPDDNDDDEDNDDDDDDAASSGLSSSEEALRTPTSSSSSLSSSGGSLDGDRENLDFDRGLGSSN